jgi:GH35 family endo-1,4-beta-xylanase
MTFRFIAATVLVLSLFSLSAKAQEHLVHTPWQLDGADERIEKIRKGTVQLAFVLDGKPLEDKAHVDLELVSHAFSFGVSMTQASSLSNKEQAVYQNRVKELFNFVTLGFYWAARDEKNDLTGYKRMMRQKVDWAVANDIKIKGHPLLWHESLPQWVIDYQDPVALEKIIFKRIQDLLLDYPEIQYWDVYNEAIAPFKNHVTPSGVTRWITHKGGIYPAMLELYAFANKTAPNKIYTNNHYHPTDPEFLKLNEYFIEKKVGYQAIGMQAHMQTHDNVFEEQELWDLVSTFTPLGKDIQFTEVTVTSSKLFNNWKDHGVFLEERKAVRKKGKKMNLPSIKQKEIFQAAYIKDFYTLLFSHPSVSSITMWNLTDKNAWRGHAAGILDEDMQPKKAFFTLKKLIKDTWSTKLKTEFIANDGLSFSGFYGKYKGTISIGGKTYKVDFLHAKGNTEPVVLDLSSQ